jgi:hypothetical protein
VRAQGGRNLIEKKLPKRHSIISRFVKKKKKKKKQKPTIPGDGSFY